MDRDKKRNTDREGYYDDYWGTPEPAPRRMSQEERERYYAQKDAYYASRDAYYARRDAFYASMEEAEDPEEDWEDGEEYDDAPARAPRERRARAPRRKRRRRKRHLFRSLVLLLIVAGIIALLLGTPPVNNASGKARQSGHSTLLLVGTDPRGGPDTVMLLSLRRGAGGVRLMSIPPDTCAEDGVTPWAEHSRGEGGRARLMDAAKALLGFAPDGLVTVDMDCFAHMADIMGGLEFRVPVNISYVDETRDQVVELQPGLQRLDGAQIVDLARWYTGRGLEEDNAMGVQKELLSAAREQWLRPGNIRLLPELWFEIHGSATTDLTKANLLWVARVLLKADPAAVSIDVLPCRAVAAGEGTAYMVDRPAAYELLKEYDPYR